MSDKERKLQDIIYEAICEIESDFDNKLTINDIYKILVKVRNLDEVPDDIGQEVWG